MQRFIIRTVRETGTIMYHCADVQAAREKVEEFKNSQYSDISISDHNDQHFSENELVSMLESALLG